MQGPILVSRTDLMDRRTEAQIEYVNETGERLCGWK
jgi:hypothetical protein